MRFDPVLSPAVLIGVGVLLLAIRMVALYRVLTHTGSGRYRPVVLRWCGLTLAVLLLVMAAFRPGIEPGKTRSSEQAGATPVTSSNLNVFLVVDRSVDTRVEDYGEHRSRMSGIREDIGSLIEQYPRARFSVISFASKPTVDWALSDDRWALKPMIAGMSPYTLVAPDAMYTVDAGAAGDLLHEKLQLAVQHHRGSQNVVFYFGVGAGGSRAPQDDFTVAGVKVAGGAVLGYGTTEGGPIPQGWMNGNLVYMSDPATGAALNSAIAEPRLRTIADTLEVPYFHRESGHGITAVLPALRQAAEPGDDSVVVASRLVERTELYWVFTLLAAALVLVEIGLSIRDFRRSLLVRQDVTR